MEYIFANGTDKSKISTPLNGFGFKYGRKISVAFSTLLPTTTMEAKAPDFASSPHAYRGALEQCLVLYGR